MGDKVSYVGQGLVSGALEQGLEMGRAPYTFVFVMLRLQRANFCFNCQPLSSDSPLSCFAPPWGIWQYLETCLVLVIGRRSVLLATSD